jgi:hypothetical protein
VNNFAILRFEKLNNEGAIAASSGHMMRTRPTLNADPTKSGGNRILLGSTDPAADVKGRVADAVSRRSNSVLTIEVLASASPEWFDGATKAQKQKWARSTTDWLVATFGEENVVHLQIHVDETTPHITGFIVPVDDKSGRLNTAKWLDGSAKLAKLQDGYAAALAPIGITRGLEGSDASHTTMRQLHGAMRTPVETIPVPKVEVPPLALKAGTRSDWAEDQSKKLASKQAPSVATLQAQARSAIATDRKVKAYQETAAKFRDAAQAARDLPLDAVAERLGLTVSGTDRNKWVDAEGRLAVTLTGQKWFDHKAQKGGGGAIDLTMHCLDADYQRAISWLGHEVGLQEATRAVTSHANRHAGSRVKAAMEAAAPFAAPEPNLQRANQVRDYLVRKRGLDRGLVQRLMAEGRVYADARGNAVFPALDASGAVRGAELRGTGPTPFHGLASGSSREATFSLTTMSADTSLPQLVLVESAVDALSYAQLHPGQNLVVASTAGARPTLPSSLEKAAAEASGVVVAYDNDGPGRSMSSKLQEALQGLARRVSDVMPVKPFKDWSEMLQAALEAKRQQVLERQQLLRQAIEADPPRPSPVPR